MHVSNRPMARPGLGVFLTGVGVGVLAVALFAAAALTAVQREGLAVRVQAEAIARTVETEVREAARKELPGALEAARRDLPRQVAQEAGRRLAASTVSVGGFEVPVPDAAARQVEAGVEQALKAGLEIAVRQADTDAMAARLGERAGTLVRDRLQTELSRQTFNVRVLWLSIPVRVVAE